MEATVETATPSTPTTTETPVSAPATAAVPATSPPPASVSPERPTSFRDALAREDAKSPQAETPAPPAAAAIVQADVSQLPADKRGPIPFDVHDTAIKNARTKATAEAEAKFNEQYGWARFIPRDSLSEMQTIAKQMVEDPAGHLRNYVASLANHPTHGPALRSEAARILAGYANAGPQEPQPDVELVNEHGQVTGKTYSDVGWAKRETWLKTQFMGDVQREFGPLKVERAQREQAELEAKTKAQLETRADSVMAELTDILDGDAALFADVDAIMAEHPDWSAHKAALDVRKRKITPTQQQTAQAAAADTYRKKAAAQTADGRASASTPPAKLTGRKDIAEFLRSREAGAK